MEELMQKLKERLNNGQDQPHDSALFAEIMEVSIKYPSHMQDLFNHYVASLSKDAMEDLGADVCNFCQNLIEE